MTLTTLKTEFASAERTLQDDINRQCKNLARNQELKVVLDAVPNMVAVLDKNRQIVLANAPLINALGNGDLENVLGLRPGELARCPVALQSPTGCGTTVACRTCGAVSAILAAQAGEAVTRECLINPDGGTSSLELEVQATPVVLRGEKYTIFAIQDVSQQNTVKLLERTFFHDILNAAGGVQGLGMLVEEAQDMAEIQEYGPLLAEQAEELVQVIHAQRDLMAAERGNLKVSMDQVGSLHAVQSVLDLYRGHEVAAGRTLAKDPNCCQVPLETGQALLLRTLGNMVKNALEASDPGETVTLGCQARDRDVKFWVHNPKVIPATVQQDIFKRSFSTKGEGRGLGTYSMKLLGEKYLGGRVGFESTDPSGTIFWIEIPR